MPKLKINKDSLVIMIGLLLLVVAQLSFKPSLASKASLSCKSESSFLYFFLAGEADEDDDWDDKPSVLLASPAYIFSKQPFTRLSVSGRKLTSSVSHCILIRCLRI